MMDAMKRLTQAPNIAVASLWADWLTRAGVQACVQRYFASGISGEIPPDQSLPEVWIEHPEQWDRACELLEALRHPRELHWTCSSCGEDIDGPFEQCWRCGANMPRS